MKSEVETKLNGKIEITLGDKLSPGAQSGDSLACTSFPLAAALAGLHMACNAKSWSRTPGTRVLQIQGPSRA